MYFHRIIEKELLNVKSGLMDQMKPEGPKFFLSILTFSKFLIFIRHFPISAKLVVKSRVNLNNFLKKKKFIQRK